MEKELAYKNNISPPKRFTKETIRPEDSQFTTAEGEDTIEHLIEENRATRRSIFFLLKKLNDIEILLRDRRCM